MGFAGLNITLPCKQAIIRSSTTVRDARAIGAVNTVVLRGGRAHRPQHRLLGLCPESSSAACRVPRERVVQFGAGGAGAAVAHALLTARRRASLPSSTWTPGAAGALADALRRVRRRARGRARSGPAADRRADGHGQCDAGRHGDPSRPAAADRAALARTYGWPTSSTPARDRTAAHGRTRGRRTVSAAGCPCSRPPRPSACSPARARREPYARAFCRADALASSP